MLFSFVNFRMNCGFFLTCLENIVYDDLLWRHDDFKDDVGIFFLKTLLLGADGRRKQGPYNSYFFLKTFVFLYSSNDI